MKYEHYREDEKIAFINLIKKIVSESTLLEEDILVCEGLFSTNVIHHGECILTISWLDLGTRVCAVIKPNKRVDTTEVTKICYIFECYLGPVCVTWHDALKMVQEFPGWDLSFQDISNG